jgi:hypothetical protein
LSYAQLVSNPPPVELGQTANTDSGFIDASAR